MKKGMTLIEVLVAVSITIVTLLSLYGTLTYGMAINTHTKNKTVAYNVASQEMEILRTTAFSSLSNQSAGPFIGTVQDLDKLPSSSGKLTIEDYQSDSKIKKITIQVLWRESGSQKNIKLVTLISKEGLNQ